jgi:hypothetical protein
VHVIYQVNGTARLAHGADPALVVTNGAFTKDAREQARDFGIHLIEMASRLSGVADPLGVTGQFPVSRTVGNRKPWPDAWPGQGFPA